MSKDWMPEELAAASAAMHRAGQMSYEELVAASEALKCDDCTDRRDCPEYLPGAVCVNDRR